jgi:dipeptidyl aminopeptidase/acylaminoacyl peptidase
MAVISPDGKLLVYAWDVNNQHTLTVRDLVSGEERVLTQGVFSRYYGLTFSRDGRSLYFTGKLPALASSLYRIPLLGGSPVRILEGIDSPVSFSPGDKRITFVREAGDSQLLVANADGTGQRQLLSRKLPEYVDYPAWSPDGKVIVASSMSGEGARLIRVEPDSGAERPAGNQVWDFLRYPVWLDGHTLVASVRPSRRASERLLLLSYPEGKAEALNLPGDRFITLGASPNGEHLDRGQFRGAAGNRCPGGGDPRHRLEWKRPLAVRTGGNLIG